jgi:hypothetical protein
MLTAIVCFFLGVLLAPAVRPLLKPALVELVKGWILLTQEVKRTTSQVREDLEDITEQAKAEARPAKSPADSQGSPS